MLSVLSLDGLTGLLAGAAAIVALIFGAFMRGRKSQRDDSDAKQAQDYRNTRERMDDALRRNDGADSREWLRDRGSK